jgi:hypothetical protein
MSSDGDHEHGAQGGLVVRRYRESAEGSRSALTAEMKTVRHSFPSPAGPASVRRSPQVAAVGAATPSRTVRVEPLVRRAPRRPELPRD